MKNIEELLQKYFDQSDHYLVSNLLEFTETVLKGDGIIYVVKVNNICDARGFEMVEIEQNDLLIWLYNLTNEVITCSSCCTVYTPKTCPECGESHHE
jgi:hypothetical protein